MISPSAVAATLRSRILNLDTAEGNPLREIALAEEFGCSRRTVREALLALDREGLVSHERNRGATVRSFHENDIRDLYLVRQQLEVQGARACVAATDQAIAATTAAMEHLAETAQQSQDRSDHALADMSFHASVIALSGSPRIDRFFGEIANEMAYAIRLLQHDEVQTKIDATRVIDEHRRIHSAVRARDPAAAEEAVLAHIGENEERLVRLCKQRPH